MNNNKRKTNIVVASKYERVEWEREKYGKCVCIWPHRRQCVCHIHTQCPVIVHPFSSIDRKNSFCLKSMSVCINVCENENEEEHRANHLSKEMINKLSLEFWWVYNYLRKYCK